MKKNPHIPEDPDRFIENNMKLAQKVAWKFIPKLHTNGVEKEDVLSMAYMGLIKAYQRFNPTKFKGKENKNICFSTYAVPVIYSEICNNIRDHYNFLSIPRALKEASAKIKKHDYTLEDNPHEISEKLNMSLDLVKSALIVLNENYLLDSLDREIEGKNRKNTLLADCIKDDEQDIEKVIIINDFLFSLPEMMIKIHKLRIQGYSQQEVAKILGSTQKVVSRLERRMYKMAEKYCESLAC